MVKNDSSELLRLLKADLDAQIDHIGDLPLTRLGLSRAIGRVLSGEVYKRPEIPVQLVQPAPPPEFPKRMIRYDMTTGQPLETATVLDLDAGVSYSHGGWMQCRSENDWQYAVKVLGGEGVTVWTEIENGQRTTRTENAGQET